MKLLFCTLLLLLSVSAPVTAEVIAGLYEQNEVVANQSDAERNRAIGEAIGKVLVRVSGHARVLSALQGQAVLSEPARFVESWRYEALENPELEPGASQLVVSFSQPAVEAVLRRYSLPIWSENRPNALIWLVRDDLSSGRQIVSIQDQPQLALAVEAQARDRGLPIVLPLMDLEDRVSLSANQLWRQDHEAILQASLRYNADSIVIGRYSQTSSGVWLAAWTVWHKDRREVIDLEADDEPGIVLAGVNALADYLADQYALVLSDETGDGVILRVEGVEQFGDFVRVLQYLRALDVVGHVRPTLYSGTTLELTLQLASSVDALEASLGLGNRLQRLSVDRTYGLSHQRAAGGETLHYLWSR